MTKARFQGGAHEHVAQFVREAIRSGRWLAGQAIDVTALAAELSVSPSPVREALARLRGEGILGSRHRDGYSLPLLQTHQLAGEYRVLGLLAKSVAIQVTEPIDIHQADPSSYVTRIEAVLTALARGADLPAASLRFEHSVLRLHSYVAAEPRVIEDAIRNVAEMEAAVRDHAVDRLTEALDRHFDQCAAAAPAIGRFVFEQAAAQEHALK